MAEVGILKPTDKVELIQGEIIEISPIGSKHASVVKRLSRNLNLMLEGQATIGVQDPIRLDQNNEPEPDISVLKYKSDDYAEEHPNAEDALILIEVSETTLQYDKEVKSNLYAKYLIPILWIIDIKRNRIEVYSDSDGNEFLKKDVFGTAESIDILDKSLAVSEILH